MFPVICTIGPLTVYSYGLMLALAAVVCTFLLQKEAKQIGAAPLLVADLSFWVIISGIIGGRLFFILLNLSYFRENPSEIIMLQRGGLAWQGALIAGSLAVFIFIKQKNMPLAKTLDFVAPYAALGQAIGRIGCFLNGCCYGREVWWGIFFPAHQARLHPTQLYDAVGLFFIFLFLKKYQNLVKRPGEVFILYLIMAAALRFFVEFFRADHTEIFWGLSIFQLVSLGICAIAIYGYLYLKSR